MANERNTFMATLAERVGTGIAARADEAGNHVFSTEIVNAYSQSGQVVPTAMQGALRELNEITQSESLLAQTSPTARMNLRGAGYDAQGRRARVAELEQFLMDNSADVRNLSVRLENEAAAEEVRALEMTNNMNEQTFQSRLNLTLSTNEAQIVANRQAVSSVERAKEADAVIERTMNSGFTIDELYEIWSANDPSTLQEVFGTTSRAAAHDALATMTAAMNDQDSRMISRMGNAVTIQSHGLASNGDIPTEDLLKYASGQLELPEGLSMLAVGEALQQRQSIEESRLALSGYVIQSEQDAVTLAGLVTSSMSPLEKVTHMAQAVGVDATALRDALYNDPTAATELSNQLAKAGPITITTATGNTVQVDASAVLQSFMTDMRDQQAAATVALSANVNMRRFMHEQRETTRIIETTLSMANGIPSETRQAMQIMMQQSNDLFAAAARAATPEEQQALITTAQQAAQQARDLSADALRATGAPQYLIDDMTQGRFTSTESVKAAQVSAAGFGNASFRGHPFGAALAGLMESKGIRAADFDTWAQDPEASLTDLSRSRLLGTERIEDADIIGIVQSQAGYLAGNLMLDGMMSSIWADYMPPDAAALLEPLMNGSLRDVSPTEYTSRIIHASQIMEQMIMLDERAARLAGTEPTGPAYQQGALLRSMQDTLNNSQELTVFLAGSPNGIPSREMAGFLTEFNRAVLGVPTHGDGSVAFSDIVPTTVRALQTTMNQALAGQALADTGRLQTQLRFRAFQFGANSLDQTAAAIMGQQSLAHATAPQREAQMAVEMAVMRAMTRLAADPTRGAGGPTVYQAPLPTMLEIEAELRSMGLDPEAVRTQMRERN